MNENEIARRILSNFDMNIGDNSGINRVYLAKKIYLEILERINFIRDTSGKLDPSIDLRSIYEKTAMVLNKTKITVENRDRMLWTRNEFGKPSKDITIFKRLISLNMQTKMGKEQIRAVTKLVNLFFNVRGVMLLDTKFRQAVYNFKREIIRNDTSLVRLYSILQTDSYKDILKRILEQKLVNFLSKVKEERDEFFDAIEVEEMEDLLNITLAKFFKNQSDYLNMFYNFSLYKKLKLVMSNVL